MFKAFIGFELQSVSLPWGILHTAAALKLATFSPDATEINNYVVDAHKEATTEQVNFASEMITTNTHYNALNVINQNPAKLSKKDAKFETLDGDPEIEKLLAETANLKGDELRAYLVENEITIEFLDKGVKKKGEDNDFYMNKRIGISNRIQNANTYHAKEFHESVINNKHYVKYKNLEEQVNKEQLALMKLRDFLKIPTAAKLAAAKEAVKDVIVTDFAEITPESPLGKLFKKMQFTTTGTDIIAAKINGKQVGDIYDEEYDESYEIYPEENGFTLEKLKVDGRTHFRHFEQTGDEVKEYSNYSDEKRTDEPIATYKLSTISTVAINN